MTEQEAIPTIPAELQPVARAVNDMIEMFNTALERGMFKGPTATSECSKYLGALATIEWWVKDTIGKRIKSGGGEGNVLGSGPLASPDDSEAVAL